MIGKDEAIELYDEIADFHTENQRRFFAQREDWTREKIRSLLLLNKDGKVLDIGCGAGDDIKWCEENGIEAYGIDPSHKMLDIAKNTVLHKDRILQADAEKIPFDSGIFDIATCRFSLHYLNKLDIAYGEISRVLKPGGLLVAVVSHPVFDAHKMLENGTDYVEIEVYDKKVKLKFPPHLISDYFSEPFLEKFDLKFVAESPSTDAYNPQRLPETLLFTARKR